MKIIRFKSKLKLFYTIFVAAPKEWQLPKKSEVLIYDASGAEVMAPYLKKYSVVIMTVRGEAINVPCFLLAVVSLKFWKGKPLAAYTENFIQAVSPKVVITFIDNRESFYGISKRFSDVKTIFIQNGLTVGDFFDHLDKSDNYHVDHMLVFGVAFGRKYKSYITGSVLALGSLKNNKVKKTNTIPDGSILFISQYRNKPKNNSASHTDGNGEPLYHHQYYSSEVIALRFLTKWCVENKKSLKIAGMSREKTGPEIDYFEAILSGYEWEYLPRTDQYSSYKSVDAAEIVVSIDSAMGIESIGRGNKTAYFSCRGVNFLNISRNFGWPADLSNNGPFWTNDQDEIQFQRIMDYLNTVSVEDWEETRQHYVSELIEFDPGNTRFIALLDQLLPRTESQSHAN
jgi:surface carbohydrate biosynthesis protein